MSTASASLLTKPSAPIAAVAAGPTTAALTEGEVQERQALGIPAGVAPRPAAPKSARSLVRRAISAPEVLNEAPAYGSAFPRGLRVELPFGVTQLLLSGTASVNEVGETVYVGDFRAQLWRTFRNLTRLLESEGATWHDVVRTTCYIRDIERDYREFNSIRNEFYWALGLDPFPASTAIQARICRSDLLVEIEAIAMFRREGAE